MAQFEFNINSLYQKSFGIPRGEEFDKDKLKVPQQTEIFKQSAFELGEELPLEEGDTFYTMRTLLSNYVLGRLMFMPMRIGGLMMPNEPSVEIVAKKTIVETTLAGTGRRGTVKEMISIGDYDIVIRGVALNFQSKKIYPETIVKKLHDLFLRNEALKIDCAITALLGIERIVIKEFKLPDMIGVQHAQAYEFVCVSDEDFELEI
jgi:Domain of unknown function (DUF6046)